MRLGMDWTMAASVALLREVWVVATCTSGLSRPLILIICCDDDIIRDQQKSRACHTLTESIAKL